MKSIFLITMIFGINSYSMEQRVYEGIDENSKECRVFVSETDYGSEGRWYSIRLKSEKGWVDTNIKAPIESTTTVDGECSVIAGSSSDTVLVDKNEVIQRRRFVEFFNNWIVETQLRFENTDLNNLTEVDFLVGATKASGPAACSALKKGKLKTHFRCINLK